MIDLSVSMPPDLQDWIDQRPATAGYVDAAEYDVI